MKKNLIFFLLFVLHLISKENKRDISESLNTLTTRLLQLNEKYASIEEGLDKILKKPTVSPILSSKKKFYLINPELQLIQNSRKTLVTKSTFI